MFMIILKLNKEQIFVGKEQQQTNKKENVLKVFLFCFKNSN